ncbi:MAG: NitT/TauT family transport system substrate-binding protein [Aliidongia sp.]|jgi:NitT/TauT family transport system substrate-binding protein|nr:NitT/TauT family transport system substrate-binding protein [Aliidongia sp.]
MAGSRSRFRYLALAALALAAPARAENAKATISQAFQSMLYLPLYVGLDEGFFAQEGLDLTKETAGAPSTALAAVLSGSAQFSLHGPEWAAIAASKGAPVEIIANVVNGAAVWIATTPDFPFTGIKDLKGQTIATGQMPTTSTSLFMKLLKENGLDPDKDVSLLQVPLGSEIGPFLNGQSKVAVMYEPGLDQAVAKGMKVVLGFPKLYGPYEFSAIAARKDVDPALAQKLANGLEKALHFIQTDPAGTVAIAKKEFPTLDPAVVEAAVRRMIGENVYPPSVEITPAALKLGLDTQIALGNLAAQPEFDAFVASKFFKTAVAAE